MPQTAIGKRQTTWDAELGSPKRACYRHCLKPEKEDDFADGLNSLYLSASSLTQTDRQTERERERERNLSDRGE